MTTFIILLVLYLVMWYYLNIELDQEKKVIVNLSTRLTAKAKQNVMLKRNRMEDEYYAIIDELEQEIGEYGYSHVNFDLSEFSVIKKWSRGACSTRDALDTLSYLEFGKAARDKLYKKIVKFVERDKIDPAAENAAMQASKELETRVVPLYEAYLKSFTFYLKRVVNEDKKQIKLIHGKTINGRNHQLREISLNQAIRYIYSQGLHKRDDKYIMCGYTLTFENHEIKDGVYKVTDVDWFICPEPYKTVICDLFDITSNHILGSNNKLEFYEQIERSIKSRKITKGA